MMSSAYSANPNYKGVFKIILSRKPEGVYIYIYENANSNYPEKDYLAEDFEEAKQICLEDYGVDRVDWIEIIE